MLKRQAATALIEARTMVVKGSVEIVHHAVSELERKVFCFVFCFCCRKEKEKLSFFKSQINKKGVKLDDDTKSKLINDLLTIFSSNNSN
jgi:hypothetical protein